MKMEDRTDKVKFEFSYEEAELLYNILTDYIKFHTTINFPDKVSKQKHKSMARKLFKKLDEYINI